MPQYFEDQPIVKGADVIYRPAGNAGEYAPLATNPWKGCGHGCKYCLSPDTLILMADGTAKRLANVEIGDLLIGIKKRPEVRRAWNYTFSESEVLNKISTNPQGFRVTLENGHVAVCSADHRWLTERGWKHTRDLTLNNQIRVLATLTEAEEETVDYRRGYLAGIIRGDGTLKRYDYSGRFRRAKKLRAQKTDVQHQFRLAMLDAEALIRATTFLSYFNVAVAPFSFKHAGGVMPAIRTSSRVSFDLITEIIAKPEVRTRDWQRGFLGGIFDAEGGNQGSLRIFNKNPEILVMIEEAAADLRFETVRDKPNRGCVPVRVLGGISETVRFFNLTTPAIGRKFGVEGAALKGSSKIVSIEDLKCRIEMIDITTSTENFIANGMVSHNCYVPNATHIDRKLFDQGAVFRGPDYLTRLERDLERHQHLSGTPAEQIFISFSSDPFHRGDLTPTATVVTLLKIRGLAFCTLSKGGTRALPLLPTYRPERDAYAATLTSLHDDFSLKWEPNAALPADRIAALKTFHEAGIFTWVSIEPTLDIEESLMIIKATRGFVDLFKIGRANYLKEITRTTDWRDYTLRAIDLCQKYGIKHYIKKDLQEHLPPDYHNPLRIQQHHGVPQ